MCALIFYSISNRNTIQVYKTSCTHLELKKMVRSVHYEGPLGKYEPRCEKIGFFASQISCAVTAQLISAFVFAIRIVQSLYYLNPKFQASSHLLWLYSLVCVADLVGNPADRFSHNEAYMVQRHPTYSSVIRRVISST